MKTLKIYETPALDLCRVEALGGAFAASTENFGTGDIIKIGWEDDDE